MSLSSWLRPGAGSGLRRALTNGACGSHGRSSSFSLSVGKGIVSLSGTDYVGGSLLRREMVTPAPGLSPTAELLEVPHCGLSCWRLSHRVRSLRGPTSIPQQRDTNLLPRRARLTPVRDFLASQEARPRVALHSIPALRVRADRPVFFFRHQGRGGRDLIQQRRSSMAQIGTFTRNEDGSFAGTIKTLSTAA